MKNARSCSPILAFGAESKGVYALFSKGVLFVSGDFGSLQDYCNLKKYEKSMKLALKKTVRAGRPVMACDMHPGYNSTILAEELVLRGPPPIRVQHHHAHIACAMAEHGLSGKVIGVAFDGTGYGPDGNVWGGEFLIATYRNFKRSAHIKEIPMPGGDKAVEEPWRMAAMYLERSFGPGFLKLGIPFTRKLDARRWLVLKRMAEKGVNSPATSSAGRLFDAAASLILGIFNASYEAEAAIALERSAERAGKEAGVYRYDIRKGGVLVLDPDAMIKDIVKDIRRKAGASVIAMRFHNTMAAMIADACVRIRRASKLNRVALSGGVFHNKVLLERTRARLGHYDFDVYCHKRFSPGDAGIAAGQLAVAQASCYGISAFAHKRVS